MLFILLCPVSGIRHLLAVRELLIPCFSLLVTESMPVGIEIPPATFCLVLFPNNLLYLHRKQADKATRPRLACPGLRAPDFMLFNLVKI